MAGDGGFSTKPMGFDKKEVNDYIGNLLSKMKDIEAEKKANDEKTQKALKAANEADSKIKALRDESQKKISDLELQLKTERRNEENLLIQIDDLKRKLKQKPSASGSTGSGQSTAAAERQAAEIVSKANATAKDIVDKANAVARDTVEKAKTAAKQVMAGAGSGGGGVSITGLDDFLSALKTFTGDFQSSMSKLTEGINEINRKASDISAEPVEGEPVAMPDFSDIAVPQAEAPIAEAPAAAPAPKKSSASTSTEDLFASLDDDFGSDQDDFDDMITEVSPLDGPTSAASAVVLEEFDLSEPMEDLDEPVSEVKPIDNKNRGAADITDDFEAQILAQAANSASLRNGSNSDMLDSVRQQENDMAVQPNKEVSDFDMGEDEDPMAAMLRQAELAFGGSTGAAVQDEEPEESAPASSGGDNPWAALQNELFAMEKSGSLGAEEDNSANDSSRAVPDADDSSIWGFGDDDSSSSSGDDDDMGMSGDLFGSF